MAIQQPIKPKSRPFTLNFGPQHRARMRPLYPHFFSVSVSGKGPLIQLPQQS